MFFLATAGEDGQPQCSYKGGDPGFVRVLDERTIAFPSYDGNGMYLSMGNLLVNPHVGLLFVVPGVTHTLRVNGTAQIVADADFFDRMAVYGKPPVLALVVTVEEVYFHCSKAFVRSRLWRPEAWPGPGTVPSLGRVMRAQVGLTEAEAAGVDQRGAAQNRPAMF